MTHTPAAADIDLSDMEFWAAPLEQREAAFAALRRDRPMGFFEEPELMVDWAPQGRGYYALTRHADILEASRQPDKFCSGQGATSIADMPPPFLDFFGSMINMDDPRHARLRRIVSAGFTPRMLQKLEEQVAGGGWADRRRGDRQGRGRLRHRGGGPPAAEDHLRHDGRPGVRVRLRVQPLQHHPRRRRPRVHADGEPRRDSHGHPVRRPGAVEHGAGARSGSTREPTDDLISALVNAEVEGEKLTDQELGSFFILLVVAGNETTRNAISHGIRLLTENPDQRKIWQADFDGVAPTAVEEIVRFASPVIFMRRTVTQDGDASGTRSSTRATS